MYSVRIIEVRNNIESRYMYSVRIIEVRIIKVHVQCTDN